MKQRKDNVLKSAQWTLEELKKLSPKDVLNILKRGNRDFVEDRLTVRNNSKRVRDAALGQNPIAAVLSCLDSRLPVEDIFHRGIGEMFVTRVAGNIVNDDILGSLEYACKVSTAKLILVLGHEHCGAIRASIDNYKMGHLTGLLSKIRPAVLKTSAKFKGNRSSENPKFVKNVSLANVKVSLETLRKKSPILREMEENGEIMILGGMYNMRRGRVRFLK